jgi:hypothetical protein
MVEVEIGSSLVVASCRFPAERAIYFHCFNAMGMGSDRPMRWMLLLPRIKSIPHAEIQALSDNIGDITKKVDANFGRRNRGGLQSSLSSVGVVHEVIFTAIFL